MGILEALLDVEWIKTQMTENPFAFWTFTLDLFLVTAGAFFGLGCAFGTRRAENPAVAQRKAEKRARRERKEKIRYLRSRLSGLSQNQIDALHAIWTDGCIRTGDSGRGYGVCRGLAEMGFIHGEGGLDIAWSLTEEGREALEVVKWQ